MKTSPFVQNAYSFALKMTYKLPSPDVDHQYYTEGAVRYAVESSVAAERERCAKICDDRAKYAAEIVIDEAERRAAQDCADLIRND